MLRYGLVWKSVMRCFFTRFQSCKVDVVGVRLQAIGYARHEYWVGQDVNEKEGSNKWENGNVINSMHSEQRDLCVNCFVGVVTAKA